MELQIEWLLNPPVETRNNVVLNKPVTVSDFNAANQMGEMAVDGDRLYTHSRWATDDSHNAHWIEIDLQGSYTISAFGLFRDLSNLVQKMPKFSLQVWTGSAWVDVVTEENNTTDFEYYKEFAPVTTDKVRWYVPAYTNNRVILLEIEVYEE